MQAYADDVVLLARDARRMKAMCERVDKYLRKRGLMVNVRKTKWMKFSRSGRKGRKEVLQWGSEVIERVDKFKYLGVRFASNAKVKKHVKYVCERARSAWGCAVSRWKWLWGVSS